MSYNPISGFALQTMKTDGQVAADYYLKFYEANSTTPLSMATDASGSVLLAKAKINDQGMPISNPLDNTTVFIPYLNKNYRLVVYTSEADADANNTAAAFVNIASVELSASAGDITANGGYLEYGGTANTITLTNDSGSPSAYSVGQLFRFRATATNTGAVTINVNGAGAKSAVTIDGAALPASYLATDKDTTVTYDGTNFVVYPPVQNDSSDLGGGKVVLTEGFKDRSFVSYNTIAAAKAGTDLAIGDRVKTAGYTTAGDGGGAEYVVVAGGTGTDDGGSYHDMANGLQLQLIFDGVVNVKKFGARCDGEFNNTPIVKAIASLLQSGEISGVYFPRGDYYFERDTGKTTCIQLEETVSPDFQAKPLLLHFYGDGTESRIIIDNDGADIVWMSGSAANSTDNVLVEKLNFVSKSIYDSDADRETYKNNYITMPNYGIAFNIGRMWRSTVRDCHFEYVKGFWHSSTDPDSANYFCQQFRILDNVSTQHQDQFIDLGQCWSCDIIGNIIESGNKAIKIASSNAIAGYGLRILRNTIQGNGQQYCGIRINHGYSIAIEENYFESNRASSTAASVNILMNNNSAETGLSIKNNFFAQNQSSLDGFGSEYYHISLNNIDDGFFSDNNTFVGGSGYLLDSGSYIRSTDIFEPVAGVIYNQGNLLVGATGREIGSKKEWTPVVSDASSGGNTGTFASSDSDYTINGKSVSVNLRLANIDTTGMTSANTLYIQGLPVPAASGNSAAGSVVLEQVAFSGFVSAYIQSGSSEIQLRQSASGGNDLSLTVGALNSGSADILVNITYMID